MSCDGHVRAIQPQEGACATSLRAPEESPTIFIVLSPNLPVIVLVLVVVLGLSTSRTNTRTTTI